MMQSWCGPEREIALFKTGGLCVSKQYLQNATILLFRNHIVVHVYIKYCFTEEDLCPRQFNNVAINNRGSMVLCEDSNGVE